MAPSIDASSAHYALVVDAGSSGSRLQIYSWRDPELERDEILSEVRAARDAGLADGMPSRWWWWDQLKRKEKGKATAEEMERRALRRLVRVGKGVKGDDWVKRVEPGISNIAPEDIPGYLAPLMAHALEHIPPSQQAHTPIYVLATAGMRLLSKEAQNAILAETCSTLRRDYPFALEGPSSAGPCGDSVRIISGEEEGIWGWVAVNYLMDGFGHAPELAHADGQTEHDHLLPLANLASAPEGSSALDAVTPVDVHHHSPTFGFLDMGGASTQLAFSPSAEELTHSRFPARDLATISLRLLSGELVEWPVFAASWLGFGTNRVRERYVEAAVKEWSSLAFKPETISDSCLPVDLTIAATENSPAFVGMGDFTQCLNDLKPLLKHDEPCDAAHCLFGGMATPRIDFSRADQRGFIGISEYWYTAHQVLGLGGVWDWAEWERGMGDFCAQDWTVIEAKVQSSEGWADVDLARLQMQCFKGAWISNVLHNGIGVPRLTDKGGNATLGGTAGTNAEAEFRARQKGLFQSMDTVRNTAISWTLGKVVIEASKAVSALPAGRWAPLSAAHAHLAALPPFLLVAYTLLAFVILFGLWHILGRRSRRRKVLPFSSLPSLSSIPGLARLFPQESADLYVEEGDGGVAIIKRRRWLQLGRKRDPPKRFPLLRNSSMPLSSGPFNASSTGWQASSTSQPPSPRGNRTASMLDVTTYPSYPDTPHSGASSSVASTPRPPRPRTTSYNPGADGGWNDPPLSMFHDSSSSADDEWTPKPKLHKNRNGALTPSARPGGERVLSRNSSRANLTDSGYLAQRNASRAGTPSRDL
ncbi:hypothetical protein CspHIS471_0503720 [Cutaneotrichosporon sp. HIS471]|nr:hypothetical protein CspHIS471_0503720 [Cutaneotrichosporon sp. HIS471]